MTSTANEGNERTTLDGCRAVATGLPNEFSPPAQGRCGLSPPRSRRLSGRANARSRPRPATQHQKPRGGNTMASRLLIRTDSQLSLPIPAAWDHGKTPLHTVSGQGSSRELTEKPPPMRRNPSQHGRRHLPRQAGKAVRLRAGCHGPARHGAGAACAFGHLPGFHADHHRTSGSRLSQRPGRTKTKKQITVRRAPTGPCRCRSCGPSGRGHC